MSFSFRAAEEAIGAKRDVFIYVPSKFCFSVELRWFKYEAEPYEEGMIKGQGWRLLTASADVPSGERVWHHYAWHGDAPNWVFMQMKNQPEDTYFSTYIDAISWLQKKAARQVEVHLDAAHNAMSHKKRLTESIRRIMGGG